MIDLNNAFSYFKEKKDGYASAYSALA